MAPTALIECAATVLSPRPPRPAPVLPALAAAACCLAAAAGCTTPRAASAPEAAPAPAEPLPAAAAADPAVEPPVERVRCFAGVQRVSLNAGGEQPGAETVVRRTLDPAAGTIVEETLRVDPLPQVPPRLYAVIYDVEGDRFELAESGGAYAGRGTLRGESWRWTGWSSEYVLTSGIRVENESEIDAAGSLVTRQRVYGPDGREVMTIEQTAEPLPLDECDRRLRDAAGSAEPTAGR